MNKVMDNFGVFDYLETSEGTYEYTAAELRSYFAAIVGNGILKGIAGQFAASAARLTVTLSTGEAWLLGVHGVIVNSVDFTLDPVVSGMSRIVSFVLDVDTINQLMGISVLVGSQAASPVAPVLTQTATRYQQLIHKGVVHDNGTVTLSDYRTYVTRPGDGVDLTSIGGISYLANQPSLTESQKAQARSNAGAEASRLQFINTLVANTAFVSDATYIDYPYRASVALAGVLSTMVPHVVFGAVEAKSGKYAPVAACYNGGVYLYASAVPAAKITVPTIICWR